LVWIPLYYQLKSLRMLENANKIKTIIIDDEQLARTRIRNLLTDHSEFSLKGEAANGQDGLSLIQHIKPDCIFLDISLPGIDGFSIIEQSDTEKEPIIIVVSGSEEHALKAFDYYAFDYLLKPYKDTRFEKTVHKVIEQFNKSKQLTAQPVQKESVTEKPKATNNLIPIKNTGKIQFIDTRDIHFVEASGYYIEINLADKKHLLRQSMARIIDRLDSSQFIRIHRSVIINLQFMQEIIRSANKEYAIKMKSGKIFKVSKSYKKDLFGKLNL
jgi:two-component system, LytTR family, response regulator